MSEEEMKNLKIYVIILTGLVGFLNFSLSFSLMMNSIIISNYGQIVSRILVDGCNSIGNWQIVESSKNTLEVDTMDKVEGSGSLKGTFAATGSCWGGMFYKRPSKAWNFDDTPLMRIWVKIHQPMPTDFHFEIVTGSSWDTFSYEILNQISIGNWTEVVIDLRLPDNGPEGKIPDLTDIRQIGFVCWEYLDTPLSFNWDKITVEPGPLIPLRIAIYPNSVTCVVGEKVTFQLNVVGGIKPYSYEWYVNGTRQTETSSKFGFEPNATGIYEIMCIVTDANGENDTIVANARVVEPLQELLSCLDTFKSDIRAMFVHTFWWLDNNYTLIAETCKNWGINSIFIEIGPENVWDWNKREIVFFDELYSAATIFKSYGFNVHVLFRVGCTTVEDEDFKAVTPNGPVDWLDFADPDVLDMLERIVASLVTDYPIDGVNYDYIRWDYITGLGWMSYSDEAREWFIGDTGLSDVNWPTDVYPGGRYHVQFYNWRQIPITEAVRRMSETMRSINPNILISASVWTPHYGTDYLIWKIGQHTADWIDKGYLDFITPMMPYQPWAEDAIQNCLDWFVGGPEGKIPIVPFIYIINGTSLVDPEDFGDLVEFYYSYGIDGWVLWHYGGPGWGETSSRFPDIRPYLYELKSRGLMEEPIWAIQNFTIYLNGTHVMIEWNTTVPTIAMVEYSNANIFNSTLIYSEVYQLYWKDINYIGGTVIKTDEYGTHHAFAIPIANQIQFRIQSIDEKGVKVTTQPISIYH